MRRTLVAAAVMAAVASPAPAYAEKIPALQKTSVGEMVMLKLPGNPKAGYKWQLNKELSRGLHLVKVDPLGWIMAPEKRSIFFSQPSILNVAVHGKAAGEADLAFDYYRTWGNVTRMRTTMVKVVVEPAR